MRPALELERLPQLQLPPSAWPQRASEAYTLPGAARFSAELDLKDPVYVVEQVMACREIWPDLERGTTDPATYEKRHEGVKHVVGDDRMDGHWFPIFCAFRMSKLPLPTSWWDTVRRNEALWRAAEFKQIPSRTTTWERLTELERYVEAVDEAAATCWRLLRKVLPEAGRHWMIDGRSFETHVRLHHACPDPETCAAAEGKTPPAFLERPPTALIEELRKELHSLAPDEQHELLVEVKEEQPDELEPDEQLEAEADETHPRHPKYERRRPQRQRQQQQGKWIWINGHRYWVRDGDTGYRVLQRGQERDKIEGWAGGTTLRATCTLLRIQVAALPFPADENEADNWPELLELGSRVSGTPPENVVHDKGLATRPVRALNAQHGIGSVGPLRKPSTKIKEREQYRNDQVDEYGFLTCEFCGSPCTTKGSTARGFQLKRGVPAMVVVCSNPHTTECSIKTQWRPCATEWLLLGPITREDELYFQLRRALREHEKTHHLQSERFRNDGQSPESRARRLGLPWQRLSLAVGGFLEIFLCCLRLGVLGTHRSSFTPQLRLMAGGPQGIRAVQRLRRMKGLLLPRGPQARKLGLEFEGEIPDDWTPVSERRAERRKEREKRKKAAKAAAKAAAQARGQPPPGAAAARAAG